MSTVCLVSADASAPDAQAGRAPVWRWLALGLLLLVELMVFTTRFDTEPLEDSTALWAAAIGQASLIGRFAISIAVALVVFSRPRRGAKAPPLDFGSDAFPWIPLTAHAGLLAGLYALTGLVIEGNLPASSAPFWFAAWVGVAALTFGALAAAAMPLRSWWALVRRYRGALLFAGGLALAATLMGLAADAFWPLLSGPTMACVEWVLRLFYADVSVNYDEMFIGARSFSLYIDAPCSGFEGVGLIGVFGGTFLWSFRDRLNFPAAFVLLPLGMATIWTLNVLRIAALVAIGASVSESVAMGGFHSQAGWLAFNAVALSLVYVAWRSPAFSQPAASAAGGAEKFEYAAGPYLLPFLTMVAVMMITTAFSAIGFDWLYPVKAAATLGVLACFAGTYRSRGDLAWSWSWTPLAIGAVVFVLWRALEPLAGVDAGASEQQRLALSSVSPLAAGLWLFARAIGSIVVVPLAEELAFRGYLTRQMINSEDFESVPIGKLTWFSLLGGSLIFGLLHGRWLAGTIAGMLFAGAAWRRGRIMDAVVAHATANALVTAYALWTGDLAAWS